MSLPQDQTKRETLANYIKEAVANLRQQELLKLRLKEIRDSVKESELLDMKDFNSAVNAALDTEKQQEKVDVLQSGLDIIDILKV